MTVKGVPVTEATLRERPDYKKKDQITSRDLAKVALESQSVYEDDAKKAMEAEAKECGRSVMTTILIYNASGYTLSIKDKKTWRGTYWTTPPDNYILNGQWGTFIHSKAAAPAAVGSCGCVIYSLREADNKELFVGWQNPWNRSTRGQCFGEVMPKDHYWSGAGEDVLWNILDTNNSGSFHNTNFGFTVSGNIGDYERSTAQFIITQDSL